MLLILAATLAAPSLPVRTVVIPPAALSKPMSIDCPVGQLTQIVLPERLILLKASAGAADDLGVAAEKSSPLGVVSVRPVKVATGTLELRGPTLVLIVLVRGVERGGSSEIRLTLAAPAPTPPSPSPPAHASTALLKPVPRAVPTPSPSPMTLAVGPPVALTPPSPQVADAKASAPPQVFSVPPSSPPAPATHGFDAEALKTAKAVGVGRREGLPGEPEMVLDTAYTGSQSVWLRFYLRSAGKEHVSSVAWEGGEITEYVEEPAGKDLRILVQLPKSKVSQRTRVTLKTKSGGTYRFALSSGTFTDFLKGLVH